MSYDNSLQPKEASKKDPRLERLTLLQSLDSPTYWQRLQIRLLMVTSWHVTDEGCWSIHRTKD
ncbi:MAG: hypothetical protein CM15mP103_08540 [Gammaproteobacteria bacterium]|nr:MAG: hypothetical protein CM15mP103_08540 [Gammaproteobacteria bacterium]